MGKRKLITAKECNEWLATLPPVPLWGEEVLPLAPRKPDK